MNKEELLDYLIEKGQEDLNIVLDEALEGLKDIYQKYTKTLIENELYKNTHEFGVAFSEFALSILMFDYKISDIEFEFYKKLCIKLNIKAKTTIELSKLISNKLFFERVHNNILDSALLGNESYNNSLILFITCVVLSDNNIDILQINYLQSFINELNNISNNDVIDEEFLETSEEEIDSLYDEAENILNGSIELLSNQDLKTTNTLFLSGLEEIIYRVDTSGIIKFSKFIDLLMGIVMATYNIFNLKNYNIYKNAMLHLNIKEASFDELNKVKNIINLDNSVSLIIETLANLKENDNDILLLSAICDVVVAITIDSDNLSQDIFDLVIDVLVGIMSY